MDIVPVAIAATAMGFGHAPPNVRVVNNIYRGRFATHKINQILWGTGVQAVGF